MSTATASYKPVFLEGIVNEPYAHRVTLAEYEAQGGYKQLTNALNTMTPEDVIEAVKKSGIRGRGGAGFPAGMKWSFLPKPDGGPRYLACNCDESEPGTCKDRFIVEQKPHLLLEGIALCCYACRIEKAYIYIRGEYYNGARCLEAAIDELRAWQLGKNAFGKQGFNLDIHVHRGAGAYICGEESALLESLEGKRGYPRMKPPFPAVEGLYRRPTVINNVGTLASLPIIFEKGPEWFASLGRETEQKGRDGAIEKKIMTTGFLVYCVSGHVAKPANYEVPCDITLGELIDLAGGIRGGKAPKAVIPGGGSMPIFPLHTPELREKMMKVHMDFEGVRDAGSLLGSAGIIVMDETTCMVDVAYNISHFFKHESCGQCTPCREGTGWIYKTMSRIVHGKGRMEDLDILAGMAGKITGRSICALGDAATGVVASCLKHFRHEFEHYVKTGKSLVGHHCREFK